MATAATARSWPYRRIVIAVLAISVVLNLLFVAGAVWTRMQEPPARGLEQRFQRIGAELDLDQEQRAAFNRFVASIRTRSDKVQQQVAPLYAAAWDEAGNPASEPAQVLQSFDKAFDKRQEINRETIAQTLDFLATLSPDQRSKFVTLARERYGSRRNASAQNR